MKPDPHLHKVRNAHRLRTGGKTWRETAEALGVSVATARRLVAEYHERRKARTLFEDIDGGREVDIYSHPAIQPRQKVHAADA